MAICPEEFGQWKSLFRDDKDYILDQQLEPNNKTTQQFEKIN
jgi:hypothetical protein